MLNQIAEYARTNELAAEPGFSPKDARWAILCARSGDYLGLVELGDTSLKRNPGRHFVKAPDLSQPEMKAGGVTKSHFLIDTTGVVAGYGKEANPKKREFFVRLLEQASNAAPPLGAAAKMLRSEESIGQLRADLEKQKAKATDKITLQIDGEFPVESEGWHEWWRQFRKGLQKTGGRKEPGGLMICFLTGEAVEPISTHPKIIGLTSVGGLAMGDVLVGFKQESFRSYGLEQSANAAMSELAAKTYQAGLNHLIANHSARLAGTLVTHWFQSRLLAKEDDLLDLILGPDEAAELNAQRRAGQLLKSIRNGERPDLANNAYFALTISSNGGRVVVRDWMEGSFEELAKNVDDWFSDLEIVRRDGKGRARPPKLAAVLAALVRDLKDVAAPISAKLYRVAARGEAIPFEAMAQALARARVDILQGEQPNHARMALIKAYHIRKRREGGASMDEQLKPERNSGLEHPAYLCGRLMAVLGKLQTSALGDIGAGVVQRYYAAASTTPALVFGRLVRGAQFHLNKIAGDRRGLAVWYERQIGEICGQIGKSMPATLTLEDQSLFALGYYQEQAALWASKDEDAKENK